jgi:hypothetical protein
MYPRKESMWESLGTAQFTIITCSIWKCELHVPVALPPEKEY